MHSTYQFSIFIKEFYETFFTFGLYNFFSFWKRSICEKLRLHIPLSTSWSGDSSSAEFSSTGYSLRGIFGLFGAGYTQSDLKFKWTNGSTTYTTNAIDVSLTPIDLFTVGYGVVTGGGVSNGTLDSSSGSTTFFNLNFGLGPVDLLAGYRMWDATHKFKNSSETKLKYNEIGLGVGFGF